MPLPKPKPTEKKDDFISRCTSSLSDKKEFKDQKQRVAVCMKQWDESNKEKSKGYSIKSDSVELDFSETQAASKSKDKSDKENKTLNKPFRLPKGSKKKFGVYVKNKKGNVIMVKFGDPNMEIKRDDKEARKAFRARHNCDTAKDKTTPRYWSCKMWSGKNVSEITASQQDFLDIDPDLSMVDVIE